MASNETRVPGKRADLVEADVTDEIVIYDQRTGDGHALNGAAAKVWRLLSSTSTVEELARGVAAKSEVDGRAAVRLALKQFSSLGLLDGPVPASHKQGLSRRRMLQQLAYAGAAIPAIQTVKRPQGVAVISVMGCASTTPLCSGPCPGNSCCVCVQTAENTTVCGVPTCNFIGPLPSPCTSSAQCGPGFVCLGPADFPCCSRGTSFCIPLCTPGTTAGDFCHGPVGTPTLRASWLPS